MIALLRQPFPFETSLRVKLVRAGLTGLFVGLFLAVFQPFGIQDWQTTNKTLKLLGFGLISGSVTAVHFVIWPALFPRWFAESGWTVGKTIVFVTALILLIALANLLYMSFLLGGSISLQTLLGSVGVTFLIGIFPTTGAVLASYLIRLRRYVQSAQELSATRPPVPEDLPTNLVPDEPTKATSGNSFVLMSDNEKDTISLTASELLFIESSDNYATVVYLKQSQPAKLLLRNTLARLESQANQPDIVRCHRSFVVNLAHVSRVTGNAQGYRLHLTASPVVVPVARQYNATLIAKLK